MSWLLGLLGLQALFLWLLWLPGEILAVPTPLKLPGDWNSNNIHKNDFTKKPTESPINNMTKTLSRIFRLNGSFFRDFQMCQIRTKLKFKLIVSFRGKIFSNPSIFLKSK